LSKSVVEEIIANQSKVEEEKNIGGGHLVGRAEGNGGAQKWQSKRTN
jgi:hypothetical protein